MRTLHSPFTILPQQCEGVITGSSDTDATLAARGGGSAHSNNRICARHERWAPVFGNNSAELAARPSTRVLFILNLSVALRQSERGLVSMRIAAMFSGERFLLLLHTIGAKRKLLFLRGNGQRVQKWTHKRSAYLSI